jgi:hypothetical protein
LSGGLAARTAALAAVLGLAAGAVSLESGGLQGAVLLVLVGAITVGGTAPPGWWWLGALAGAGVPLARLATGQALSVPLPRLLVELVVPIGVAVAGSGLGASLRRLTGDGQGDD